MPTSSFPPFAGARATFFSGEALYTGRADSDEAAVAIWVKRPDDDTPRGIPLPKGGNIVRCLTRSPDGRFILVTHNIAGFNRATTHLHAGWLNASALTILGAGKMALVGTVLLDEPAKGAANPWGAAWSSDSATVLVAHSGAHEISIIDFSKLLDALTSPSPGRNRVSPQARRREPILFHLNSYEGLETELPFLIGGRKRLKLPEGDLGPREVTIVGKIAYVTNYFSRTTTVVDLDHPEKMLSMRVDASGKFEKSEPRTRAAVLASMSPEKRGEFYFYDATICFQGWQSCASCHPGDGRADGFNWDLLNDGFGNPKNTKSLLLAFETPPAMSTGVRESARDAVRAGLKHILFAEPKDEIADAVEAYIRSLKPSPSPRLVNGKLSQSAVRGEKAFRKAGCAECHPSPLFTDLNSYDVGTRGPHDKSADKFDTPTLVEVWRTPPYLHDGSAATIRDVLTIRNSGDEHGRTSGLSDQEITDLCEYVLSL